jgi:hypothetical protein
VPCIIAVALYYFIHTTSNNNTMNQFITRIVNHVVNEVLIEGLAKSRVFQRFAVRTDATFKDVHKVGTETLNTAFEEIAKQQVRGSSTVAGGAASGPPQKPLTGFPGFAAAFVKEIRKDLGLGR